MRARLTSAGRVRLLLGTGVAVLVLGGGGALAFDSPTPTDSRPPAAQPGPQTPHPAPPSEDPTPAPAPPSEDPTPVLEPVPAPEHRNTPSTDGAAVAPSPAPVDGRPGS